MCVFFVVFVLGGRGDLFGRLCFCDFVFELCFCVILFLTCFIGEVCWEPFHSGVFFGFPTGGMRPSIYAPPTTTSLSPLSPSTSEPCMGQVCLGWVCLRPKIPHLFGIQKSLSKKTGGPKKLLCVLKSCGNSNTGVFGQAISLMIPLDIGTESSECRSLPLRLRGRLSSSTLRATTTASGRRGVTAGTPPPRVCATGFHQPDVRRQSGPSLFT